MAFVSTTRGGSGLPIGPIPGATPSDHASYATLTTTATWRSPGQRKLLSRRVTVTPRAIGSSMSLIGAWLPWPHRGFGAALRFATGRRRPFALHLGDAFHVDGRLLPFLLGRQRLQQRNGVCEIVVDGLPGRGEVDLPDLGQRRRRVGCSAFQRRQRDEAGWSLGHRSVPVPAKQSGHGLQVPRIEHVLRLEPGATRRLDAPVLVLQLQGRMCIGGNDDLHASVARYTGVVVVQI